MKIRSIVVLGGTGFVGQHLAQRLHGQLQSIVVPSRNRDAHRELAVLPRVRLLNCDIHDRAALTSLLQGADAVVNLVGILNESGRSGRGFERAHVALTANVIASMQAAGVRRLLQMSALNAGNPASHYLRTRGAAEQLVQASGLDWTVYRPSVIFGRGDGLFTRFAGLLRLLPGPLPLARAGARFQPVAVTDVVEAMARTLDQPAAFGQCYELVGPETWTLAEIVRYTGAQIGRPVRVIPLPDFLARLQGLAFDFLPLPLKAFSSDNFGSLRVDSTSSRTDLRLLGIEPTPLRAVVPRYLGRADRQQRLDELRRFGT